MRSNTSPPSFIVLVGLTLSVLSGCGKSTATINKELVELSASGDAGSVQALIDQGAEVNAKHDLWGDPDHPESGFTALHAAAGAGHVEVTDALLKAGADANATRNDGETPIYQAIGAFYNSSQVLQLLIDADADVNAKTSTDGYTGLQVAAGARGMKSRLVRQLLEAGADPNATNSAGETALHVAARGFRRNPRGAINVLRILLEAGADPTIQNKNGKTPLEVDNSAAETIQHFVDEVKSSS